jgi:Domain of unknown function (DUF4345)
MKLVASLDSESSANPRRLLWSLSVMNARVIIGVVGAVTVLLGLCGLFRPEWVMNFVGYAVASNAPATLVRGEIRAVYGGLMVAAGIFTLLAAPAPRANRGRLLLLALLWLGAGGGRLFGAFIDGNPGLFGWLAVTFELGFGGALLYASEFAPETAVPTAPAGSEAPPFRA